MLPFLLLPLPPKLSIPQVQRGHTVSLISTFAKTKGGKEKKKKRKKQSLRFFFPPHSISNTINIPKSELFFLKYFLNCTVLIRK